MAGAGDADLLASAAKGDRDAFATLYERHAGAVYRFCLARLRDREAAADACQETFGVVWSAASAYSGTGPVLAWMLGIARRKSADVQRAPARRDVPWPPDGDGRPAAAVPGDAHRIEDSVDVWAALSGLPRGQQEAVLLTYGLGLSCQEAGQVMGVPPGTVKSRLHAARLALARTLRGPSPGSRKGGSGA